MTMTPRSAGWTLSPERDKSFARKYLDIRSKKDIEWAFIRAAISSVSDTAIIPIQDYLGLGSSARINTPSTLGCNWKWRMKKDALTQELAAKIFDMCKMYGRVPKGNA